MRALLLSVLFFTSVTTFAQRSCASLEYNITQAKAVPALLRTQSAIETFIQTSAIQPSAKASQKGSAAAQIIRIPVVVHVLYATEAQNISEAQIQSGIAALNRDFRRLNWDTSATPDRFKPLAADTEIEFVLATSNPKGIATNGIDRKKTSVTEWKMDDKIKSSLQGGADAWDASSYLNIWLGPMRNLLGYSSAPGSAAQTDGIVINSTSFGTINARAPYHLGRTVVHEVGHWLGLKHIWGDTYCGDDLVYDTPKQGNFTSGSPTGFRSSCSNGETGDMYMNYMDFTDDAAMNLFTKGQKERMRALFNVGGPRALLLSSKGLNKPWATEEAALPETAKPVIVAGFKLYPNPTAADVVFDFSYDASWLGKVITISNAQGVVVKKETIVSKTQKVSTAALKPGTYFIEVKKGTQRIAQKLVKL